MSESKGREKKYSGSFFSSLHGSSHVTEQRCVGQLRVVRVEHALCNGYGFRGGSVVHAFTYEAIKIRMSQESKAKATAFALRKTNCQSP